MTQLKLGHCLAFSSLLHNISIPPIAVLPLSENLSVNTALQHFCREITVPVAQNREQNLLLYCIKQPCVKLCKVALLKDQTSIFGCHGPMPGEYTTSSAVFWGFSSIIPHCLECTCPGLGKACQVPSPAEPDHEPDLIPQWPVFHLCCPATSLHLGKRSFFLCVH